MNNEIEWDFLSLFLNMRVFGSWILLAGSALVAGNSPAVGSEEPFSFPDGIILVARSASPKILSERLSVLADGIGVELQPELLAYILWGTSEAPPPKGISLEDSLGVALLRHGRDYVPILLGRMDEESPYRGFLPEIGFTLADIEGWTFAVREPLDPELLEELAVPLIRAVERTRRHDLEVEVNTREVVWQIRQITEDYFRGFRWPQEEPDPMDDPERTSNAFVEPLTTRIESVAKVCAGIDLGVDGIGYSFVIAAREGSELAGLLEADHFASLDPAAWLADQWPLLFLSGVDFAGIHACPDPFSDRIDTAGGELTDDLLSPDVYRELFVLNPELLFTRAKPYLGAKAVVGFSALPPIKMILRVSKGRAAGAVTVPVRWLAEFRHQLQRLDGIVTEDQLEFEIDDEQQEIQ